MEIKLLIVLGTIICFSLYQLQALHENNKIDSFNQWQLQYAKFYQSSQEQEYRLSIFLENLQFIEDHNQKPGETYKLGPNQFMDLTKEEFLDRYGAKSADEFKNDSSNSDSILLEQNVQEVLYDWTSYCSNVKNQGNCGSSWAFATAGIMECYTMLQFGQYSEISEQQLIDCVSENNGCESKGEQDIINSFEYANEEPLSSEQNYPYQGEQGRCQGTKRYPVYRITQFEGAYSDKYYMVDALSRGPIVTSFDISGWQFYQEGIFNCSKDVTPNHHAIIVKTIALKDDQSKDYIVVKNSWGETWGQKGYIKYSFEYSCRVYYERRYYRAFQIG